MKRLCAIVIGRHELGTGLVHADRLICSAMPIFSNSGRLAGNSDSPMWKRGWWAFSSTTTWCPFSASKLATVEPAGPPPITSTSQVGPGSPWAFGFMG
ncbi:hypothetical protein Y695_01841 [Hydrogenophaga sp. T4]|nr:hypothetical protein Y695_01841 [Hydrogenophaga sp. T4]